MEPPHSSPHASSPASPVSDLPSHPASGTPTAPEGTTPAPDPTSPAMGERILEAWHEGTLALPLQHSGEPVQLPGQHRDAPLPPG